MSKGKKGGKEEKNPLEGVTFDQLSEKEKQLARLILQSMEPEEQPDSELSLPEAILQFAEKNPDLDFSEKERQLIDKLKSEKYGEEVSSENKKPTFAEQLQKGKEKLKHVEPNERPKQSGPSFSELIADKAAEMQEKRNASKKKENVVEDDFLKVTKNEHSTVDKTVNENPELSKNSSQKQSVQQVKPVTKKDKLLAVVDKAGVTISPQDKGALYEVFNAIQIMDRKPASMDKFGSKLLTIETVLKKYPGLQSHVDEFCQVFEEAAKKPDTVKFLQDNHLNAIRQEYSTEQSREKPKTKGKTTVESSPLTITDGSEVKTKSQEPEARDSVVFSSSSKSQTGTKNISTSEDVDPITQAIRDEILKKQQLLLQQEIAKGMERQEKQDFLKQDLTAIRSYLQTEEGKQAVDNAMKSPELRKQMHAIERDGYKTVHNTFKDSFRDVDWGKINEDKIRTTDVKDADGNPVCTLKETTVDTKPQSVMLADGTTQTINKYRKIDFPIELETGNGPMHVSMAVRDTNGRPISAKEAVYFTAHYDDNGKLTEVSSPTPVHFAGEGPDAIGYIEVDGKAYTLPVTRGKYQEMMREVARNNGLETEISQSVEKNQNQEQSLTVNNAPTRTTKEQPLSIEDVPKKKEQKEKPLTIEDAPKKPKEKLLAIEDAPKKPKEEQQQDSGQKKTEMQELADKMRKSREARGNESAEPESKGGGKPVNVKGGKLEEQQQDSGQKKTEMQELADKMRESRKARSNESAEPESKGGGKPVNVKGGKQEEQQQDSGQKKTEMQELADKMRKSREARGNESAEPESKGGGKPVNVKGGKLEEQQQDSGQKKTEMQELADKMRESRKARGNESAEPESKGGGKPVNVKGGKQEEQKQDSGQKKTEMQELADKMRESRKARGNESAEPESKGGGKPVNVKTQKVSEKESAPKLNEAQKMAQKMKKSRADRDNVVAESESRGGGKAVNVKDSKSKPKIKPLKLENPELAKLPDSSSKDNLLDAAKNLANAVSDLTKSVKEIAQRDSNINAMTGKEVSSAVKRVSTHTRTNVDPVLSTGSKVKTEKTRTMHTPNVAQNKDTGHSR